MSKFSPDIIAFSKQRMKAQGDDIRKWANDLNPVIAQACREIMEAANQ